jgi:hypothetical protein
MMIKETMLIPINKGIVDKKRRRINPTICSPTLGKAGRRKLAPSSQPTKIA